MSSGRKELPVVESRHRRGVSSAGMSFLASTADIAERRTADCLEFLDGDTVVGRLVWTAGASTDHEDAGWWLEVPGTAGTLLYRAATVAAEDLEQARRESESATLYFARSMIADRVAGLLAPRGR
jgi:hypothetical protein